jgi:hypothetical protein
MKLKICFFLAVGIVAASALIAANEESEEEAIEFHGPNVRPGYPDAFHTDYVVRTDTISPNHKYAVIVPDNDFSDNPGRDFVVALDPPLILALLETPWPEFENKNHGGMEVEWSEDNSVALLTIESKWGPGDFVLVEFKDGRVSRTTPLGAKIRQSLEPDYRKAKAGPYNDYYHFIFEEGEGGTGFCKLNGSARVEIDGEATTDPKGLSKRPWRGRLQAVWDIAAGKFVQQKVTRLSGRD